MNAMPPDAGVPAATAGAREWLARLEATPPWLFEWLRQQHDGPYWRQGSLAPDYDAIEAAILNIGGWMDSYVDAGAPDAGALHGAVADDRRQLGPRPARPSATPGPNLDELHELVRFFDRWLQGHRQRRRRRAARRLVRARVRRAGAVPGGLARAAGGRRARIRIRPVERASVAARRRVAAARRRLAWRRGDARRDAASTATAHRPTVGHAGVAVVGRRRPAQRPGPRPAPRRGARPDLHLRAARRGRSRSSASRRSSSTSRSRRRSRPRSSG